jgi:glycolate oxidase iron-sulfur subunit
VIDASLYARCVRCGLCLTACPTYLDSMVETSGPRGRIRLMVEVAEGRLSAESPGFVAQMAECLGCRSCEAVCPSGVEYGRLLEQARAAVVAARAPSEPAARARLRRFLLHDLLARPALLRALGYAVWLARRLGLEAAAARIGLLRLLRLERAQQLAPPFAPPFFAPRGQHETVAGQRGVAAFHAGCVAPLFFPRSHEAALRVLRRLGWSTIVPRGQACCGALAMHAGEPDAAKDLARRTIHAFERTRADIVVSHAAGCSAAMKEYGAWFASDPEWSSRARAFSAAVRDFTEVLDDLDRVQTAPFDDLITYQDACHLAHAQRIASLPRTILTHIQGERFTELVGAPRCCGAAGIYNLLQPRIADRLQAQMLDAILASGATIVVTTNPGCAMQIAAGLRARNADVRVRHLAEVVDEACARYERTRPWSASASASVR